MIKELFHYLTLNKRSKKDLNYCLSLLSFNTEELRVLVRERKYSQVINGIIENMTEKDNLHKLEILEKLSKVASGYKMRDHILLVNKILDEYQKDT
jgi:hypothetical protein